MKGGGKNVLLHSPPVEMADLSLVFSKVENSPSRYAVLLCVLYEWPQLNVKSLHVWSP